MNETDKINDKINKFLFNYYKSVIGENLIKKLQLHILIKKRETRSQSAKKDVLKSLKSRSRISNNKNQIKIERNMKNFEKNFFEGDLKHLENLKNTQDIFKKEFKNKFQELIKKNINKIINEKSQKIKFKFNPDYNKSIIESEKKNIFENLDGSKKDCFWPIFKKNQQNFFQKNSKNLLLEDSSKNSNSLLNILIEKEKNLEKESLTLSLSEKIVIKEEKEELKNKYRKNSKISEVTKNNKLKNTDFSLDSIAAIENKYFQTNLPRKILIKNPENIVQNYNKKMYSKNHTEERFVMTDIIEEIKSLESIKEFKNTFPQKID